MGVKSHSKTTGYVHVYTGDGKGKTSAALGLIVRAVGAGLRVYFCQFIKCGNFSEIKILRARFPEVTVRQYGAGRFIKSKPSPADVAGALKGLSALNKAVKTGKYDLVVIDEACGAVSCGLFKVALLEEIIKSRPKHVELVFTGRNAGKCLIKKADIVTEMKCVKHYYTKGVKARHGIEF